MWLTDDIKNFINTPTNRVAIAGVQGVVEQAVRNQIKKKSSILTEYDVLCKIKELAQGTQFQVEDISELLAPRQSFSS